MIASARHWHTRATLDWWCDVHRHLGNTGRLSATEIEIGRKSYAWGEHPEDAARKIRGSRSSARERELSR